MATNSPQQTNPPTSSANNAQANSNLPKKTNSRDWLSLVFGIVVSVVLILALWWAIAAFRGNPPEEVQLENQISLAVRETVEAAGATTSPIATPTTQQGTVVSSETAVILEAASNETLSSDLTAIAPTNTALPTNTPLPTATEAVSMILAKETKVVQPATKTAALTVTATAEKTQQGDFVSTMNTLHALCDEVGMQDIVVQSEVQQASVRISTEQCSWQVNFGFQYSEALTLPVGYIGTLHLVGETNAKVYIGDGSAYNVHRGTIRFIEGFNAGDDVHEVPPCRLAEKEYLNGIDQIYPFEVVTGNFNCPDLEAQYPGQQTISCPAFGGHTTTALADGGCKLAYEATRGSVTANVPQGWKAIYWDGSAVQEAASGQEITTGEVTFYLN